MQHLTPHEPLLGYISLPLVLPTECIRTGAYTDAWYILQRHCSRIVIRHMHAWPTYGIAGSRSQDRSTFCLYLRIKQGFRRKSDHSAEFNFIFQAYRVQSTSCMVFLIFCVRGRTRCSKVMSIHAIHPWILYLSVLRESPARAKGKTAPETTGDNTFHFISFYFINFLLRTNINSTWELIYPTNSGGMCDDLPVAGLLYTPYPYVYFV